MKKIPVMIVDDEKLVLEDLKTLVDWDALGFEIVATAFNGKQAWIKYNQYHPQVVFTDVRMPFMNGLELISRLRAADRDVVIFLLTAYEDFSYAKTAIQYGIKDYVIKSTLDETSFSLLLKKLKTTIEEQQKLKSIVKGGEIAEFLEMNEGEKASEEIFEKAYVYLLVEQDEPVFFPGDSVGSFKRYSQKEITAEIMQELLTESEAVISSTPKGRILLVLDISSISQMKIMEMLQIYARRISTRLEEKFQCSFTVYIIDHKRRLQELKSYENIYEKFFNKKYFTGCGQIIRISEYPGEPSGQGKNYRLSVEKLEGLIEKRDPESLKTYIQELFLTVETAQDYKPLRQLSLELYDILNKNYRQLPRYVSGTGKVSDDAWKMLFDITHVREWFTDQYMKLMMLKEQVHNSGFSRTVIKVMEYISVHYGEHDLTIRQIADDVRLSSGHLCSLFKKETGKTLNNYITEVRIKKARELLAETDLKVYEVSEKVGYQSSQYFSQIFYKTTGIYPTAYQKEKWRSS